MTRSVGFVCSIAMMVEALRQGSMDRAVSLTEDMVAAMRKDGSIDLGISGFDLTQLSAFADSDEFDDVLKSLSGMTGEGDAVWDDDGLAKRMNKANSLDIFKKKYFMSQEPITMTPKAMPVKPLKNGVEETTSRSGDTTVKGDDPQSPIVPANFAGFAQPIIGKCITRAGKYNGLQGSRNASSDEFASGTPRAVLDTAQKKQRRMLSNRESARRSRKRKQEMMMELEGQVCKLTHENDKLKRRIRILEQSLAKKDAELQKAKNM